MDAKISGNTLKSDYWEAAYADGTVLRYKYQEKYVEDLINPELIRLKIPEGVVIIEYLRLGCCHKLESIHFPASILVIGYVMIANENCLHSITVEEDNPKYCAHEDVLYSKDKSNLIHFHNKKETSHFNIPPEVSEIGQRAFENCQNLRHITIPDSVKTIQCWAFANCDNLEEINIPENTTSIWPNAFHNCPKLKKI